MPWRDVYWKLAHGELHLLPAQVDELTVSEVELILDVPTDKPRMPEGFRPMSPFEMAALSVRHRKMDLAERVRRAKEA